MSGAPAPAKPWERKGSATVGASSATPLGPSTANDGAAKPWESTSGSTAAVGGSIVNRTRPWDNQASSSGYGMNTGYNSYGSGGYGSSSYGGYGAGSTYGRPGYGSTYGGGGYGSNYGSYGSGYGSSQYGMSGMGMGSYSGGYGGYGSSYGGGYGGAYGAGMGGMGGYRNSFGMGGMGSVPYGQGSQFGPDGPPPQPPSAWQHMLHAIGGVVNFFGRISFLVDENAHAFHFFISALLQLLDRGGSLYGELARFVLRLLGFKDKSKELALQPKGPPGHQMPPPNARGGHLQLPGVAPAADNFDNLWKSD